MLEKIAGGGRNIYFLPPPAFSFDTVVDLPARQHVSRPNTQQTQMKRRGSGMLVA